MAAENLSGHAIVEWSAKKRTYRFDQAMVIENADKAKFETLDDFGNTVLRLEFTDGGLMLVEHTGGEGVYGSSRFRKLLSLPLTQDEFISYLLYRLPEQVDGLKAEYDSNSRLTGVEKKAKQTGKRYKISFRDFEKKGSILYPKTIEMTSRKTSLKISWRNVQLK